MRADEEFLLMGQTLWNMEKEGEELPIDDWSTLDKKRLSMESLLAWRWAVDGFTKIISTHTYLAALGTTTIEPAMGFELNLPWKTFLVVVPSEILRVGERQYDRIMISSFNEEVALRMNFNEGKCRYVVSIYESQDRERVAGRTKASSLCFAGTDLNSFLFAKELNTNAIIEREPDMPPGLERDTEAKERVILVARRIVAGIIFTFNQTNNFSVQERCGGGKSRRNGLPLHRLVKVGRPVDVDVRDGLRDFIEGRRNSSPSFQTLVRGHYQRYGASKQWQWKEPFWRGPEEAKILLRPRVMR